MKPCVCDVEPTIINDENRGEMLCSECGTVFCEKEVNMMWVGEDSRYGTFHRAAGNNDSVTKFVTTSRIASDITGKRCAELARMLTPILEHVSASKIMIGEAELLIRRMISDGFAKGKNRLALCAGIVLAICRVYGRMVKREELAMLTGTGFKKVSRVSMDVMERYGLKSLSIEDRTRRVLSRMCVDIGEPGLLRPALDTYNAMLLAGHAAGKRPYVVAAYVLGLHTKRIMSEEKFAESVGVSYLSMRRYVGGLVPNVC